MCNCEKDQGGVLICRCNEVTEDELRAAIADGCTTLKGIKNRTEAMMGLCQGKTCQRLIERMLNEANAGKVTQAPSHRAPTRTIPMGTLLEEDEE